MAKKRKCRYTPEEIEIHEQAVRLRRMTDAQLVTAFQSVPRDAGVAEPEEPTEYTNPVEKLLSGLESGEIKGIKGATAYKVREYAAEKGLI